LKATQEEKMKVLVVGATGLIGSEFVKAIAGRHEVIAASHSRSALKVDIQNPESIKNLYQHVGKVDAVVSAAGNAAFGYLPTLTDADFAFSLGNKLMGQVNLVRFGLDFVTDGGSFTLTSGVLARKPMPKASAISLVNSGLEGFGRAAALDLPRGMRINVVAPGWITETLIALKMDPAPGVPVAKVAKTYVEVLEGKMTGQVVESLAS
jgi:NAD(P)-dependent dehydrogenase (short-subunit alcohol dehydrogenase family)